MPNEGHSVGNKSGETTRAPRGVELGAFIRARRKALGLDQKAFAKRANMTVGSVRALERGTYTLDLFDGFLLERIENALQCEIPPEMFPDYQENLQAIKRRLAVTAVRDAIVVRCALTMLLEILKQVDDNWCRRRLSEMARFSKG